MTREVNLKHSDSKVIFEKGSFDDFCVYVVKKGHKNNPPKDVDYFSFFKKLDSDYKELGVYDSFIKVYENTGKSIQQETLSIIDRIVLNSGLDEGNKKKYEGYLVVIYMAMIAEENKANTRLGKRIKRLGMHNLLIDDMTADVSANISKGKTWRELDVKMRDRGF